MSIVRQSKFRHVFGGIAKREATYEGLKPTDQTLDSNMIKVNNKFIAYIYKSSGGGAVSIIPITQVGKTAGDSPLISGHKGPVTDLDFSPSNPNILATGSEDTVVRLWTIPPDGLTPAGLTEPTLELKGHGRKQTEIFWNPNAEGILATAGLEPKIIVWDAKSGKQLYTLEGFEDQIQSFAWNDVGNLIATQSKDKKLRVFDVRANSKVLETASHVGLKTSKVLWSNQKNWLLSPGYGKGSDREFLAWDVKNPVKPLISHVIDQSSAQILPFFDEATQLLYIGSRGEASIGYYELDAAKAPYFYFISKFGEGTPARGLAVLPKLYVNTKANEVTRLYRLTQKATIEPVTFTVPRRSEMFQQDLYPPVVDTTTPAQTSAEWLAGSTKPQRLFVFTADGSTQYKEGGVADVFPVAVGSPIDSASAAESENIELLKQNIAALEASLPEYKDPAKTAARIAQLEGQLKEKNDEVSDLKKKVIALGGKV